MLRNIILINVLAGMIFSSAAVGDVRLKDVATVRDQRAAQLIGYGLVVGLDGTGDGRNTQFTIRTIGNMLQRMGIEVPATTIKVKNVAAVMVTATVSPYVKAGGAFDVTVSSVGDASSLEGGTLLLTPLQTADGLVRAKAQGPVSVGGTNRDFGSGRGIVNLQLVGAVPGGGILELDLPTIAVDERSLMVMLRDADFTTAFRLANAINSTFGGDIAMAQDAGNIMVSVPNEFSTRNDMVGFISLMENVTFEPDETARVIINERTGTIIAGGNVSLAPVAIMHGTLSIDIGQNNQAAGQIGLQQRPAGDRMVNLSETSNVSEVAQALNMLQVTPRDMIAIFQALKRAGSLRAELIVM